MVTVDGDRTSVAPYMPEPRPAPTTSGAVDDGRTTEGRGLGDGVAVGRPPATAVSDAVLRGAVLRTDGRWRAWRRCDGGV